MMVRKINQVNQRNQMNRKIQLNQKFQNQKFQNQKKTKAYIVGSNNHAFYEKVNKKKTKMPYNGL
jgi:hypothetical protein